MLVVDDTPANRYVVCRALQQGNYSTIEAATGQEALEKAQNHRPDAIVLDMNLPDQTGVMILQSLRELPDTKLIPVVFLSATSHSAFDRTQADALGASAYLFSPVEPDTLVSVVTGIIERGVGQ